MVHVARRFFGVLVLLGCAAGTGCATTAAETARGKWFAVASPRFRVWTDGDPEQARALVVDLERFHQVAMKTTTAEDREAAPPLRIFLAKDGASFRALTGRGGMLAGLFRSTYRGNYAITEGQASAEASPTQMSDRHVLFHEYTHYILALERARVPSWYNEGFAEYMATTEFRDGAYTVGCPPLYRTSWVAYMEWLPIAKVLEAENVGTLMRNGSGYVRTRRDPVDSYAQSWYMFHYFASDGVRQKQLREYLRLRTEDVPVADAVQRAMGQSVMQLDALMHQYALEKTVGCLSIKPGNALVVPEVTVQPVSLDEAQYHVGDLMLEMLGPTDAVFELLRDANKAGARPQVLRALARAHWDKAERAEDDAVRMEIEQAEKYLQQAQKLEPDQVEGLAIEGHIQRVRASRLASDAASRSDAVKRARKAYRKAIKADEAMGEAYFGLGLTYLIEDNGSEEARVSLEVAAFLLPLETGIGLALGKILVGRGSLLEAIPALEYVLRWSPSATQRDEARAELDKLRKLASEGAPAPAAPATAAPAP